MGVTYVAVNSGTSLVGGLPRFADDDRPQFTNSEAPVLPSAQRPEGNFEGRREGEDGRGVNFLGMIAGSAKNIIIIAVFVALIAVPRSWWRNRKRTAPIAAE
jgi:hypothetical protein